MKSLIKKYQDILLVIFGLLFLGILISYFVWGMTSLALSLSKAISQPKINTADLRFDLEGAKRLGVQISE